MEGVRREGALKMNSKTQKGTEITMLPLPHGLLPQLHTHRHATCMHFYALMLLHTCTYLLIIGTHAQRGLQYLVCVSLCVCVSALICRLTHWNQKREIPTNSSQYGNNFNFVHK